MVRQSKTTRSKKQLGDYEQFTDPSQKNKHSNVIFDLPKGTKDGKDVRVTIPSQKPIKFSSTGKAHNLYIPGCKTTRSKAKSGVTRKTRSVKRPPTCRSKSKSAKSKVRARKPRRAARVCAAKPKPRSRRRKSRTVSKKSRCAKKPSRRSRSAAKRGVAGKRRCTRRSSKKRSATPRKAGRKCGRPRSVKTGVKRRRSVQVGVKRRRSTVKMSKTRKAVPHGDSEKQTKKKIKTSAQHHETPVAVDEAA